MAEEATQPDAADESTVGSDHFGASAIQDEIILEVEDLRTYFATRWGTVKAVDGVSFNLRKGETLGIVGESGSGKSVTSLSLMRLVQSPPGHIVGGEILLDGQDMLHMDEEELRSVRLADIALVPQGAMNSLNPVLRVQNQIMDGIADHNSRSPRAEMLDRVYDLLESVGLSRDVATMFPHELSGGMKQRVAMAIAISLNPKVILADEPTSALDVVVQRQIMSTLGTLQEELGAALILVGHDMGLMAQFANRVGVMYAGKLVELGPVEAIFAEPLHPYTKLLISSLPTLEGKRAFVGIPGLPPALLDLPSGCVFHPRCPSVMSHCSETAPALEEVSSGRWVSCHLYGEAAR